MGVRCGIHVEMQFTPSVWTPVTAGVSTPAEVRALEPMVVQYGIDGSSPIDRVASAGSFSFPLDNQQRGANLPRNQRAVGRYSPLHANRRTGFDFNMPVRLRLTYAGTTYYKFRGRLADILPEPGYFEDRVTRCRALDWMDDAAKTDEPDLAAQINQRGDQILATMFAALGSAAPDSTSLGTGVETFAWALDGGTGQKLKVRERIQQICLSEWGYAYVRGDTTTGGTFTFENRRHRSQNPAILFTFDNDMIRDDGIRVPGSRDDLYRSVQVVVHPTRIDAAATTVLYSLQTTTTLITPGQTFDDLFGPYRDPVSNDQVGGTDMQAPSVSGGNNDYAMNANQDGSGADLTANFSVSSSFTGSGVRFSITNNGGTAGYITKLQVRGKGVYRSETVIEKIIGSGYGDRVLRVDMPFGNNVNVGDDVGSYLASIYANPFAHAPYVRFLANASDAKMRAALAREPGDRIAISETMTGLDEDEFTINSVRLEIDGTGRIWCTWGLEPASQIRYWLLGNAGASELGESTVLGF